MDIIIFLFVNQFIKNKNKILLVLVGLLIGFFNGYSFSLLFNYPQIKLDKYFTLWYFYVFFNVFYFLTRDLFPTFKNPKIIDGF